MKRRKEIEHSLVGCSAHREREGKQKRIRRADLKTQRRKLCVCGNSQNLLPDSNTFASGDALLLSGMASRCVDDQRPNDASSWNESTMNQYSQRFTPSNLYHSMKPSSMYLTPNLPTADRVSPSHLRKELNDAGAPKTQQGANSQG